LSGAPVRWDGVVLGAQVGYSSMSSDFGNATSSQIAYMLRNTTLEAEDSPSSWTTLPSKLTSSNSFGVFLGYNKQMDDLVLGADIAYNRPSSLSAAAADSIARTVTLNDGSVDNVGISAASSLKLIAASTRAGYAFGQLLPYAVLGGAVGRFDYINISTVTVVQNPPGAAAASTFGPVTQSDSQQGKFGWGFVCGLGLDVVIMPNVFMRGEWETIAFTNVGGIASSLNTVRAGVGVRF
jgi:outer membrane immunogenic protein